MKERTREKPPRSVLILGTLTLAALIFTMPLLGCKEDEMLSPGALPDAENCEHIWKYSPAETQDNSVLTTEHNAYCDKCKTSKTEPHRFGDFTSADGKIHQRVCSDCGFILKEDHNFGAFTSVDGEIHQRVCSDCGYILQETHNFVNGQCTVCGQKEVTGTESDNPTNTTVHKHIWSTAWTYNKLQHWHVCTFAGGCKVVSSLASHAYVWRYNESKHWLECICGRIIKEGDHDFPQVWTTGSTQHWHVCSVCGTIAHAADHTYTLGVNLQSDETNHWYLCSVCGEKIVSTVAPHDNEWVADSTDTMYHYENCKTCNKKGEKKLHVYDNLWDFDCNLCGYTRYVPLPIVPEVPDELVPGI